MDVPRRKSFRREHAFSGLLGQFCLRMYTPEDFELGAAQERFGVPRPDLQP
jgi:hypothetical protein